VGNLHTCGKLLLSNFLSRMWMLPVQLQHRTAIAKKSQTRRNVEHRAL
jgi:hypothetical protein